MSNQLYKLTNAELFDLYAKHDKLLSEMRVEMAMRKIDWQHLASYGFVVAAMSAYREKYNTELREAHEAVKAFIKELKK